MLDAGVDQAAALDHVFVYEGVVGLDDAEDVALLVFAAGSGGHGAVEVELPQQLAVLGGHDGCGVGMLFGDVVGCERHGSCRAGGGVLDGGHAFFGAQLCHFFLEAFFGQAGFVVAVLAVVHGQFEEFFVVLAAVPAVVFHFLDVFGQGVGVGVLGVAVVEFEVVLLGQLDDFGCQGSGQFAGAAEDHVPAVLVDLAEAGLALGQGHDVHEGDVFGVLAEGGHQWGIAEHGPDVGHLLEELDGEFVEGDFGFAVLFEGHVDGVVDAFEVAHHAAHHAAGQSAAHQHGGADAVGGVDVEAEEVVEEGLGEGAGFHVGAHVDVLDQEAVFFEHGLHGDDAGMDHAPGEGFHGGVDDIGAGAGYFEHGGHGEAGTGVAVVLDDDVGVFLLNLVDEFAQHGGTADAGHVFQGNLVGAELDELVDDAHVVFDGVDG